MKRSDLPEFIRVMLIAYYTFTLLSKILTEKIFKAQNDVQSISGSPSVVMNYAITFSEILIVFLLIFKPTRTLGLYLSATILVIFLVNFILNIIEKNSSNQAFINKQIINICRIKHFPTSLFFLLINSYGIFIDRKKRTFIGK
jgi:hypothetical protein